MIDVQRRGSARRMEAITMGHLLSSPESLPESLA
jgi:hypothetical protein